MKRKLKLCLFVSVTTMFLNFQISPMEIKIEDLPTEDRIEDVYKLSEDLILATHPRSTYMTLFRNIDFPSGCKWALHGFLNDHKSPIIHTVISSDGNFFASASEDGDIRIWDMHRNGEHLYSVKNENNCPISIEFETGSESDVFKAHYRDDAGEDVLYAWRLGLDSSSPYLC